MQDVVGVVRWSLPSVHYWCVRNTESKGRKEVKELNVLIQEERHLRLDLRSKATIIANFVRGQDNVMQLSMRGECVSVTLKPHRVLQIW